MRIRISRSSRVSELARVLRMRLACWNAHSSASALVARRGVDLGDQAAGSRAEPGTTHGGSGTSPSTVDLTHHRRRVEQRDVRRRDSSRRRSS